MRADARRNRDQILESAREQITLHGDDLTMDDVALGARVAVGTIYRHFPTKTDLVQAVVAEAVGRLAARARTALDHVEEGAVAWDELVGFWIAVTDGPHAGRTARLAADLLGVSDGGTGPAPAADDAAVAALDTLRTLLEHARTAGDVREDVTVADLFLLMSHAPGRAAGATPGQDRARYFEIVGAGLRPCTRP